MTRKLHQRSLTTEILLREDSNDLSGGPMDRRTIAVLLSIIPGFGHLYLGYPFKAIKWFFSLIIIFIMASVVNVFLHGSGSWILIAYWVLTMASAWELGKHTLQAEDLEAIRREQEKPLQ
jgi:hypothetical protein